VFNTAVSQRAVKAWAQQHWFHYGFRQSSYESCGSYLCGILPVSALHACPHILCHLDHGVLYSSET